MYAVIGNETLSSELKRCATSADRGSSQGGGSCQPLRAGLRTLMWVDLTNALAASPANRSTHRGPRKCHAVRQIGRQRVQRMSHKALPLTIAECASRVSLRDLRSCMHHRSAAPSGLHGMHA
eukprot:364901-Chlamydomonas_euryale.AAC.5